MLGVWGPAWGGLPGCGAGLGELCRMLWGAGGDVGCWGGGLLGGAVSAAWVLGVQWVLSGCRG